MARYMLDLELFRLVAADLVVVLQSLETKVWPGLQLIRYTLLVFLSVVVELMCD